MRRVISCLVLVCICLAGCGLPTKGYVYNKWERPTYVYEEPVLIGKTYTFIPVVEPATYYLDITSCSSLQTDGTCQTNEVEVTLDVYSPVHIGDYYIGE